jgi:hypothetical protein
LLLLGYLSLGARVWAAGRRRGLTVSDARWYALSCVLGKVPSAYGQLRYWVLDWLGKRSRIIEHKRPTL